MNQAHQHSHRFDPTILREYDIRGLVDKTLRKTDAYAIGRAFGTLIVRDGGTLACTGYDGRASSPYFEVEVAQGLADCGLKVIRIGLGPTPMLYFATKSLGADGGIMITGSHNPPEYNGFKMIRKKGAVYGTEIQSLGTIAAKGDYVKGTGLQEQRDMLDTYVARLSQDYRGIKPLNIAWDAGNGAAGEALKRLVTKLPGKHTVLYAEIDGTFPNHHPDPTVAKNLIDLQKAVRDNVCDLGIAFDGDGDRIGVVDGKARILWGDQLMLVLAQEVLAEHKGATIIADVKASQVLFDGIEALGGRPLMWKTGHSLIKTKMAETKAPLAGEMSGHIFFADRYYGFDDALYAAVRLISFLSRSGKSLSELRDGMPAPVNTPELRFPCTEDRKFAVVEEVRQRLKGEKNLEVIEVDGVRVRTKDGWWLLRASNTQDVLVARVEAADAAGLTRLKAELIEQLKASGIAPPAEL
ncbi:MAG: phosphomannomutase/phosphoglucomutase [Alphaproteobacteria bacterium]